eukprot:Hpha_TRINITY_DN14450_c0_g3::TRINITY_DN14450_c0_g3_i1::g.158098::m.158098
MATDDDARIDEARKRVEGRRVSTKLLDADMESNAKARSSPDPDAAGEESPTKRELPASLLPQLKRLGPAQLAQVADALQGLQKAGVTSVEDVDGLADDLRK